MARQDGQRARSEQIPAPIDDEARRLAHCTAVTPEQARACLQRLADALAPNLIDKLRELEDALTQFPLSLFRDAIDLFGGARAVRIIEEQDLRVLANRVGAVEYLLDENTPFLTLEQLAGHTVSFKQFLVEHRDYLVKTGLPPRCFRPCRWLYKHLGRLYDVKVTGSPLPHDEIFGDHDAPPYQWRKKSWRMGNVGESRDTDCEYDEADLLAGMEPANARRIESMRPRVLDVKLRVLDLLAKGAAKQDAAGMWDGALAIFKKTFNARDINFLCRMDGFYFGADGRTLLGGGVNPKRAPGGVTNLLEVIGHIEAEIKIGVMHHARTALDDSLVRALRAPPAHDVVCRWNYFKVFDRPDRALLDATSDRVVAQCAAVAEFWQDYCDRVSAAMKNEFRIRVPIELDPRHAKLVVPFLRRQAAVLEGKCERGELIDVSLPPPGPVEPVEPVARNCIRFDGSDWVGSFEGESLHFGKLVGFFYIAWLLAKPHKQFSATELRVAYCRFFARSEQVANSHRAKPEQVHDASLHVGAEDDGEVFDKEYFESTRKRVQEIEAEIDDATRDDDHEEVARLKEERAKIADAVMKARRPDGTPVRFSERTSNDRDQVRNRINGALNTIKRKPPSVYQRLSVHLHNSLKLKRGTLCSYEPETDMDWAVPNNL